MKIGKLEFKDYAAKKPLSIAPTGEFLTASEVAARPALSLGSLFMLDQKQQVSLTVERYKLEPDFKAAIISRGLFTKDELVTNIKDQTPLGKELVRAEMGYCDELVQELAGGTVVPAWPIIPSQPVPVIPDWRRVKRCISLKVTNRALFCENTTDSVTTPFANYRIENVHPVFRARGFNVVVLSGADDVRANFTGPASQALTVYISGIGHGGYTVYTGHWHDHILEVGHYNADEVSGKAMHFLSCQTGRDLGPDCVAHGALSYAGYIENFILVWDDGSTPAVNEFELFARSDSTFDIAMANGATAAAAFEATIAAFNTARAQVPGTVAATYLTLDRDRLRLHGDGATTIQSWRYVKICFPIGLMEKEDALVNAGFLVNK